MVDYMRGRRDLIAEEDTAAEAATRNLLEALHEFTRALNAASDLGLIDKAEVSRWLASNYALAARSPGGKQAGEFDVKKARDRGNRADRADRANKDEVYEALEAATWHEEEQFDVARRAVAGEVRRQSSRAISCMTPEAEAGVVLHRHGDAFRTNQKRNLSK